MKRIGIEWGDELCHVLSANVDYAYRYTTERFAEIRVARPQGTYMMFLDCSEWLAAHRMTLEELLKRGYDVGVAWQDGRHHGGTEHIRLNLALPNVKVREAFDRLDRYVFN